MHKRQRTKCYVCVLQPVCTMKTWGLWVGTCTVTHHPRMFSLAESRWQPELQGSLTHRLPPFTPTRANGSATLFFLSELIGDILSQSHYLSNIAYRIAEAGYPPPSAGCKSSKTMKQWLKHINYIPKPELFSLPFSFRVKKV